MSRAGKYPIEIKNGVSVEMSNGALNVKGPKGQLSVRMDTKNAGLVEIKIEGSQVSVNPKDADDKASRAMWGTMARNIKQAIEGVTVGFLREMGMKGVGFKATVKGRDLVLVAGFSHDVILPIPEGLTVEIGAAPTEFTIKGIDKNLVGQFADMVRKVRKPEPYKGKGIFYKNEKIRRKEGKKK
ncbi:MAG: 50S ribosomal protein L6 [Rickettsiales bacterium]|jgi:large subunit ribosomal protein L6|nr:50S ribosomal protein L6 [Rickettsiales bacterium]